MGSRESLCTVILGTNIAIGDHKYTGTVFNITMIVFLCLMFSPLCSSLSYIKVIKKMLSYLSVWPRQVGGCPNFVPVSQLKTSDQALCGLHCLHHKDCLCFQTDNSTCYTGALAAQGHRYWLRSRSVLVPSCLSCPLMSSMFIKRHYTLSTRVLSLQPGGHGVLATWNIPENKSR